MFQGDLSYKHVAVLVGQREIGINTLLINPNHGTRLMFVSVVTNTTVQPDSPFTKSLCSRSECKKCVTACPVRAISSSGGIYKEKYEKYYRQDSDIYFETWGTFIFIENAEDLSRARIVSNRHYMS